MCASSLATFASSLVRPKRAKTSGSPRGHIGDHYRHHRSTTAFTFAARCLAGKTVQSKRSEIVVAFAVDNQVFG
jgi:hypothetical protein